MKAKEEGEKSERSAKSSLRNLAGRSARGISDISRRKKKRGDKGTDSHHWKHHQSNIQLEVIQTPGNMKPTQWVNIQFSGSHNLQLVISSKALIHASESMQSRLWKMKVKISFLNIHALRETSASILCHVHFVQTYSASWTKKHLLKEVGCLKIVATLRESCADLQEQKRTQLVRFLRGKQRVGPDGSYLTIMSKWRPLSLLELQC